jgi:tetratricopeptide (TPR) repeat protein
VDASLNEPDVSADTLAELAATDPERVRRVAIAAAVGADPTNRVSYLSVAAEASVRVGAVSDGLALFRRAADAAASPGDGRAGTLRVRLAAMQAATGDSDAALATLDAAEPTLGADAWRAWYQRGLVLHWAGDSEQALDWLTRAEGPADAAGDHLTVAKLVMNRALAHAHVGDVDDAVRDAADAEDRCRALGELTLAAHARHNRGWIAGRAGDLAEGWRLMHDAAIDPSWTAPPVVLADRAELAHAAGLLAEAAELADAAVAAQRAAGDEHGAAETALLRARIALDLGDCERALELAVAAGRELSEQGRASLHGAAAAIEIAASRDLLLRTPGDDRAEAARLALDTLSSALDSVASHPWRSVRVDGRIAAGELHALAGRREVAARLFSEAERDRREPMRPDVHHHVAGSLARLAETGRLDEPRLESAWAELCARRAMPSVFELRGDWGAATRLLARTTLPVLLDEGDAEGAIRWLERLRPLSVPAPGDDVVQTAAALRAAWLRRRHRDPTADGDDGDDDEARLEAELVDRARLATSTEMLHAPPTASDVVRELGATQIVWVISLGSGAWTLTLSRDAATVRPVDPHRLQRDATHLASAIRLGSGDWRRAATDLDATVAIAADSERVVVIPVGNAVEDVPFAALPSLATTRLRTCWSGAHWLATRRTRTVRRVTLAAADVDGSAREIHLLRDVWPHASTLLDTSATCANVLAALASADLVHIGAHGHLRRDNPMLSTLQCSDGPLYGYELARSSRVASTILLWSCALGGARMPADVGVAGWPSLLARLGCDALIAAPGALPSAPAPDLAVEVHRRLARGDATDAVLADVRGLAGNDDLTARAAAMLAVHGAG